MVHFHCFPSSSSHFLHLKSQSGVGGVKFPNANCCIKVSHRSGQFCLPGQAKVTQVRLSEIWQQVFVRILQAVKAALPLTHTRRHVPRSTRPHPPEIKKKKTLAHTELLLMFCWMALQRSTKQRNSQPQLKRNHIIKKKLQSKASKPFDALNSNA